ncbi:MAG: histidinol-phosphatase [Chloroflexi bacterium]|nr:MAG: histidinol-phosphatase [Chloroflexota bacterium]TMD66743.1 MAG: histidinol-phosphatase [Chloroflexota bacterium]
MSEREDLLAFAMELADQADRIAMRHFRRDLRIDRKPDRTYVTQADTEIEKMVRDAIQRRYPGHGVLAEEFGDRTANQDTRWIIDPIDATHSYMRGIPVFATLLALERGGVMELGVISAPAMHERWHAVRGGGAWSGKRRLRVSEVARLEDAQIFYASRTAFKAVGRERGFDAVVDATWRDRGFGDFWGYMLVAEGAGEAMIEPELYSWDLAAPLIIVQEAGGRLTDLTGRPTYAGGNAVATNGVLHELILQRLHA